jgi:hypothetical protein
MKKCNLSVYVLGALVAFFNLSSLAGQAADQSPDAKAAEAGKPNAEPAVQFSAGLEDVVKLVQAGVEESVVLAYIQSSAVAYHPSASEIIKLRELGVSSPVIDALLRRGDQLRERAAKAQKDSSPQAQPASPGQSAVPATLPPVASMYDSPLYSAASPTVVYAPYPAYGSVVYSYGGYYPYVYSGYYPRYYPSCYPRAGFYGGFYPGISVGLRFGGGHSFSGHGGFRHGR